MCVVSNVGDYYGQRFQPYQPQIGGGIGGLGSGSILSSISREEFDQLKREVLEMKDLLLKAKEIDAKTGQPDCEQEDKVALLKAVAKAVGVSLDEVFK